MTDLVGQAEDFAAVLTEIVNGTFTTDAQFQVTPVVSEDLAWVLPADSTPVTRRPIPVTAGLRPGDEPRLWVRVSYLVALDRSGEHLEVRSSVFALDLTATTRPAVRVEYERHKGHEPDGARGRHRRSAAHVQVHGSSTELGYAVAVSGGRPKQLQDFHIPVGGRRYRPTIEDFIEFLHDENLVPGLHEGWEAVLDRHRRDWLALQLRAAVRNDPEVAAEQLRRMGWGVTPPGGTG